jgi:hypothetical protein
MIPASSTIVAEAIVADSDLIAVMRAIMKTNRSTTVSFKRS